MRPNSELESRTSSARCRVLRRRSRTWFPRSSLHKQLKKLGHTMDVPAVLMDAVDGILEAVEILQGLFETAYNEEEEEASIR